MNNALRQAGYEGVLFPELDELEPVAREDAQAWDEYEYQFRRAAEQIYRAFETVPGLWDRVAAIMTRLVSGNPGVFVRTRRHTDLLSEAQRTTDGGGNHWSRESQ